MWTMPHPGRRWSDRRIGSRPPATFTLSVEAPTRRDIEHEYEREPFGRRRRRRLRRRRLRQGARQARRRGDPRRPAQLPPVPTAAVPGGHGRARRSPTSPARCGASSASDRTVDVKHGEVTAVDPATRTRHHGRRPRRSAATTWCWRRDRGRTSSTRRAPRSTPSRCTPWTTPSASAPG